MIGIYAAMENGTLREENLQAFYALAVDYESAGRRDLAQFLEFLDSMEEKGLISYQEQGKARVFSPNVSLEHVAARETDSLLNRAYKGSLSMLVSNLVQRNGLSQDDIDELYAILKQAEEDAK